MSKRSSTGTCINTARGPKKSKTRVEMDQTDLNQCLSGSWELSKKQGLLVFHEGLDTADFEANYAIDTAQLVLTSIKGKFPLVYKGECEDWNNCQGDFHVRIEVSFEPSKLKEIKVNIDVSAMDEPDYGPPMGGTYSVFGKRK